MSNINSSQIHKHFLLFFDKLLTRFDYFMKSFTIILGCGLKKPNKSVTIEFIRLDSNKMYITFEIIARNFLWNTPNV